MLVNGWNMLVIGRDYDCDLDDIADWLTSPECAEARCLHGGH
jgi:hypothetical protein